MPYKEIKPEGEYTNHQLVFTSDDPGDVILYISVLKQIKINVIDETIVSI